MAALHFEGEALGIGGGGVAEFVGEGYGGDDVAVGERLLAGSGEEAVDVGLPDAVAFLVAFALDSVEFLGALGFGDEVDSSILGREAVGLRPIPEKPHVGVKIPVFRLVAEVGADEFLEVGALFALGLGLGAVGGENLLQGTHGMPGG